MFSTTVVKCQVFPE